MDVTCPECGHTDCVSEFQDEEEFSPDLFDRACCPECSHEFELD
jgi:hypothetical protein